MNSKDDARDVDPLRLTLSDIAAIEKAVSEVLPGAHVRVTRHSQAGGAQVEIILSYSHRTFIPDEKLASVPGHVGALVEYYARWSAHELRVPLEKMGMEAAVRALQEKILRDGPPETSGE